MFIPTMTAGPTEPTADQLQNQLEVVVDDLEVLYTRGILIKTPRFPKDSCHISVGDGNSRAVGMNLYIKRKD
jgi:hypothetical protein